MRIGGRGEKGWIRYKEGNERKKRGKEREGLMV